MKTKRKKKEKKEEREIEASRNAPAQTQVFTLASKERELKEPKGAITKTDKKV